MARKIKQGLSYFSMDIDFFENDKIQLIESEFGIKGSYIALRLLCKIYKEGYYYQWGDDQCLLFAKAAGDGIVSALVKEVVNGLIKRGFFDKTVFDTFNILTSKGIQERYFEGVSRYKSVSVIREYLLVDVSKLINVHINSINVYINSINVNTSTQIKGNKIKEKEIKEEREREKKISPPPTSNFFIEISKLKEFLESESQWCEVVSMQNGLTQPQLQGFINEFVSLLASRGDTGKSPRDAKSHFANWLKIELNNALKTSKNHATTQNNVARSAESKSRLQAEFAEIARCQSS